MELLLATENMHKLREYKALFKLLPHIELLSLHQFPDYLPAEETGSTLEENALLKAETAAIHLNRWVLADDSGLIVPALNGAPGIYSRRYAGPNATDGENRKKLLQSLDSVSEFERSAYFECVLALVSPNGTKKSFKGVCEGRIIEKERGRNGFGYDPIFVKQEYEKTFAELEEGVKNRISHRAKAFERLRIYLENLKL